jgi:type II secretory pathway component PulL
VWIIVSVLLILCGVGLSLWQRLEEAKERRAFQDQQERMWRDWGDGDQGL